MPYFDVRPVAVVPEGVRYDNAAVCLGGHAPWLYAVGFQDTEGVELWRREAASYMVAGRKVWLLSSSSHKGGAIAVLDVGTGKEEIAFNVSCDGSEQLIAGGGLVFLVKSKEITALG